MYQERDHDTNFLACNEAQKKVTSVQSCGFVKSSLVLELGKTCFISSCGTTADTRCVTTAVAQSRHVIVRRT